MWFGFWPDGAIYIPWDLWAASWIVAALWTARTVKRRGFRGEFLYRILTLSGFVMLLAPLVRHVIWGPGIYLVPRLDGRLIVGATVEEKGFDSTLTAGGLLTLLEAAWRAVPAIEELPIDEMWVGHRPGSRDDAPILGPAPLDGLIYATGHHRNGILLAPVTADTIARLVLDGTLDPAIRPFGIERFTPAKAAE